jgi:hypothetical protein
MHDVLPEDTCGKQARGGRFRKNIVVSATEPLRARRLTKRMIAILGTGPLLTPLRA